MGLTKGNAVRSPGTKTPIAEHGAARSNESESLKAPGSLELSLGDNLDLSLDGRRVLDSLIVIAHNVSRSSNVGISYIIEGYQYSCIY